MFEQYILKVAWLKFDATHADACKKKRLLENDDSILGFSIFLSSVFSLIIINDLRHAKIKELSGFS